MPETVVQIHAKNDAFASRKHYLPDSSKTIDLPNLRKPHDEISAYLESMGLQADAKALWIGYPGLKQSVERLVAWVGIEWPSEKNPLLPAIFEAIELAVRSTKEGLERQETDRRFVIANFHNGLAHFARDIAGYVAWGCSSQKAIEQWEPFLIPFQVWCDTSRFDKIIFKRVDSMNEIDMDGLLWKMRSTIASVHDVGVIHRYGAR